VLTAVAQPNDALNASIAGALVGAAITAFVTLLIFIIDRIVRVATAARDTRRDVFAELFTAVGNFAVAAAAPSGDWASVAAALQTARSRVTLALGLRQRTIGVWLTGMEALLHEAALMPRSTPATLKRRTEALDDRAGDIFNTLTNLQQRRLFVADFTLPAGVFHLMQLDPTYRTAHGAEVDWARRPQNGGRFNALVAAVIWRLFRIREWFVTWRRPKESIKAP
jgi:hypothetical protein